MADATSSAISPTVQSTSNYAPATSNGQNAYDLQRQQAQAQADQQKQAQQAALKRRLAAQGISDSGVNIAAANTVDQNVASTEGAALSNIDTQQLQAAQAADTAAQQYGYNTALQGQQITGNLQNTTLQGQNQMNVQGLVNTGSLQDIGAQGTNQIQAINAQGQVQSGLNLQQYGFTTQEASAAATYAQQLQAQVTAGQLSIASANAEYQQQLASMQAGFTSSQIGQQGVIQASAAAAQYGYNTGLQSQSIAGNLANTTLQGSNQMNVQGLVNTGALQDIGAQGQNQMNVQGLVNTGALQDIGAQGQNQMNVQGLVNTGALQDIGAQGQNQMNVQTLVNTGALQDIGAQGQNQMNVQTLVGTQQLTNINATMNATDTEASYAQTIASQNQVATGFYQAASVPGAKPTADQQAAMNANPLLAAAWQAGQSGVPYTQWQQQQTNAQNTQKAIFAALPVGQGDTLEMIDSVGQSLSNGQNFTQAAPSTIKMVNGVMTYELNGQTYDMATNQLMTSAATSA